MPKYRVRGASIETGREVEVVVEAAHALAAQERANRDLRIAVSEVDINEAAGIAGHVTIERTSKKIKARMVAYPLIAMLGFALMLAPSRLIWIPGLLLLAVGIAGWIRARFQAWWHHG